MFEQTLVVDYTAEMLAIFEQPLTPRVIERYADDALRGLVSLVSSVTIDYEARPTVRQETTSDTEDAACYYFGLPELEGTLTYIQHAASEIRAIDPVVKSAPRTATVITPPDTVTNVEPPIGETAYESTETAPRLKSVLFVLSNEFGIDVQSADEIELELGAVRRGMRRKHGYYYLNVPSLNRTMLICDEMNNATYMFANDQRYELDLDDEEFKALSKPELDEYIETYPGLGARIEYSDSYIDDVTSALRDLEPQANVSGCESS